MSSCSKNTCGCVRNLRLIAKQVNKLLYQEGRPSQDKSLSVVEPFIVDILVYQQDKSFKSDKYHSILCAFDDIDYSLEGVLCKDYLRSFDTSLLDEKEMKVFEILSFAWNEQDLSFDNFYK